MSAGTILVCDDDPAIVDAITVLLERRGYGVITVSSGADALELAARHRPDAIVLDLMMPRMSGWKTARALREQPETQTTPIIILSRLAPDNDPLAADPAAISDIAAWLKKPVDGHVLVEAVERSIADTPR